MIQNTSHNCKICRADIFEVFKTKILSLYDEPLYKCSNCGFLGYGNIHWLDMAYQEAINISDTGLISRNIFLSQFTSAIAYSLYGKKCQILDGGGGTGMLVRLLRDIGFDAYWQDKYCENIFAKGFEYNGCKVDLITSFEVFEHLPNPIEYLQSLLAISKNILFSTELIPSSIPPRDWDYYSFEHGQHISFYDIKTLDYLANKYNLYLNTNGHSLHLFTQKPYSKIKFKLICKLYNRGIFTLIKKIMPSKTLQDSQYLIQKLVSSKNHFQLLK